MTGLIVALLAIGFALIFLEIFVPGAILGITGTVCLIVGVWLSFHEFGATKGAWILAGTALAILAVMAVAIKVLPRTWMGKYIFLSDKIAPGPREVAEEQERQRLVGRTGVAQTDLRPAGRGLIEGKRCDVVTDGSYIEQGKSFQVVRVEGARIVVAQRETEEQGSGVRV